MKIYKGQLTLQTVSDIQQRRNQIIYTFWKQPQLVMSVRELEVEISSANDSPVDIRVVKIDVGWGWDYWK